MQVDQGDLTSQVLLDISLVLRASVQNQAIPPPVLNYTTEEFDFTPPNWVVWVNALWFSSLICSLGAAVAVMVVKQWLQFYSIKLNSGNTHLDALHRQYRYNALKRWKVLAIVSALPLLMHLAVGLFFAGLVIVLWNINMEVATVILTLVVVFLACYTTTMLLPFFIVSCPYKSSALLLLQDTIQWAIVLFWTVLYGILHIFEILSNDMASAIKTLQWGGRKLGFELSGLLKYWIRSFYTGTVMFFSSPPQFAKTHLESALSVKSKDLEESCIEKTQPQLDIDSVIWLIRASGKQDLVDIGLACISQLKPEPNLIQLCLRHNIQTLLIDSSYLCLPDQEHDLWKKLKLATPLTFLTRKEESRMPAIQTYMQSLMFLWHHSDYYSTKPPPAVSISLVWDQPAYFADSHWKLRMPEAAEEISSQPPPRIFGDWLILWRALKEQSDDFHTIAFKGWNLNFFAEIVCVEAHFSHLTRGSSYVDVSLKRDSIQDPSPWSDQYELIRDYGQGVLQLTDRTVENILDTFIYVVSSNRRPEDHVLLRAEVLLALLQLLRSRQMMYDAILQKAVLSLQMFTMEGWKRKQRGQVYWKNGGLGRVDRNKVYQGLATVLYTLATTHLHSDLQESPKIVDVADILLYRTQLELDQPDLTYDETLISLPPQHAAVVLQYIDSSALHEWRTLHTLLWTAGLVAKWCQSPQTEIEERELAVSILGNLLCFSWSENVLGHICSIIFPTFRQLLDSEDADIARKVSEESCHSLQSMFHRDAEHRSDALLTQYIDYLMFSCIAAFLKTDKATPKSKQDWTNLRKRWKIERSRDGYPNERAEYEILREQTHIGETPDATPLLAAGNVERAPTPSKKTIIWKTHPEAPDDNSLSRYSPSSPRNSLLPPLSPRSSISPSI